MAGGLTRYRHLSRTSSHRQALLRNLVTSLVKDEAIHTTWPKAKEAQRLAEKLITLAKRNNEPARRKAQGILFTPHLLLPKLFGELRERYAARPGGYTRVLRTEPKDTYSQAPSAVLELVDGPKDMRFAMTAAAVARDRRLGRSMGPVTRLNVDKVTRFRPGDAAAAFEAMIGRIDALDLGGEAERERAEYRAFNDNNGGGNSRKADGLGAGARGKRVGAGGVDRTVSLGSGGAADRGAVIVEEDEVDARDAPRKRSARK